MKTAILFTLMLAALPAFAAPAKAPPTLAEKPKWYLVKGSTGPLGYYVETVGAGANKDLLLADQKSVYLGSNSANAELETVTTSDDFLTPVSFDLHFRRRDGSRELKVSAVRKRKGVLRQIEITLEKIKPVASKESKTFPYPQGAVFYSSLPRWLARMKPGLYVMKAIIEDIRELDLVTKPLRITRTSEKKNIGGQECERSYVDHGGDSVADMWVSKDGVLCSSRVSDTGATIESSTEDELKKLDLPPANPPKK
jgi:hypothetical protein